MNEKTSAEDVLRRLVDITNKKIIAARSESITQDKEAFGEAYADLFPKVLETFSVNIVRKYGQKKVGVLVKQLRDPRLHAKVYASI